MGSCVCLLQVYHGPRESLPGYIRSLGFHVPDQVNVQVATSPKSSKDAAVVKGKVEDEQLMDFADFLSEFLFLPHKALPVEGIPAGSPLPPLTSQELQDAWKKSQLYADQMGMSMRCGSCHCSGFSPVTQWVLTRNHPSHFFNYVLVPIALSLQVRRPDHSCLWTRHTHGHNTGSRMSIRAGRMWGHC
jgi:hypothetical protein